MRVGRARYRVPGTATPRCRVVPGTWYLTRPGGDADPHPAYVSAHVSEGNPGALRGRIAHLALAPPSRGCTLLGADPALPRVTRRSALHRRSYHPPGRDHPMATAKKKA